ncbi:probable galacturonosyltransferase 15 [Aristolochia californica]|uniref:probable galacturonosyltransferase 15 n=1 Tax=Aristolochia californica TaxID=171875 RepID=UPI0035D7E3D5
MHFYISPGGRRVTISSGGGCFWEVMKVKGSARRFSYRSVLSTVLIVGVLLPFLFIRAAFLTLEGTTNCSSIDCIGWTLGPGLFRRTDPSTRLTNELTRALLESRSEATNAQSFDGLLAEVTSKKNDIKVFISKAKAMLLDMERKVQLAKREGSIYFHMASIGVPKSMHCLSLRLAEEYSVNSLARSTLPPPEFVSRLTDTSYYHITLLTDNVLAAGVVVTSCIRNSKHPEKYVFHVVTDKKTYAPMHAWFALNSMRPVVVEVKGLHQFDWPIGVNVGATNMMKVHRAAWDHDYRNRHSARTTDGAPYVGKLERLEPLSPSSVSVLNHLKIYLPELFPELDKIVLLEDDVVVQHDLSPLWSLDLNGKVNGAVGSWRAESYEGEYCLGTTMAGYLNFSDPLIRSSELQKDQCAWHYGLNVFDLQAWRKTNITNKYHQWLQLNADSGFTLWRLGSLPPALIAFTDQVQPIDPMWHVPGLGNGPPDMDRKRLEAAAVIHFSGPAKPWLPIGFPELQSLWNIHVNYTNELIRSCGIME